MKFDLLFRLLKKYKADYIATGHYARLGREFPISNFQFPNNDKISKFKNVKLLEASDKTKDQSYFLYRLNQKELAKIIFPLGELKKTETKKMAKKFGLPVSGDEESQDVCFLADQDINQFLRKYIKPKPGNIVDEKGKILAKHKGLPFYTIGQRKGIAIGPPTSRQEREVLRASGTKPYYVIEKNIRKNELVVSNDPKKLFVKKFEVKQVNWLNKPQKFPSRSEVRIRYHSEKFPAIIKQEKSGRLVVEAAKPVRAVTAGQSAVFYNNIEVLGGGIIF
jgi:tRNA-specific 2-thiouridylase